MRVISFHKEGTLKDDDLSTLLDVPDLANHIEAVDREISSVIGTGPDSLAIPALRLAENGGKRLRAVLVIGAACGMGAAISSDLVRAAAAIELVHQGSLVHDDLMDGTTARRGIPTVNALEGSARAILVGDYLLARAGYLSARISQSVAEDIADTLASLCTGQVLELEDLWNQERAVERSLLSIYGKTAALMSCACRVAALCARPNDRIVTSLGRFGTEFGMAFQLIDDVLDIVSTETLLGKPVGVDIRGGVFTVPVLIARDLVADAAFIEGLRRSSECDDDVETCLRMIRASGAIHATIDMARQHCIAARHALEPQCAETPGLGLLAQLPERYIAWAIGSLAPSVGQGTLELDQTNN